MLPLDKDAAIRHMLAETTMQISQDGIALLVQYEGFSPTLYNDPSPAQNCTIGYGYKLHDGPCDGRAEEVPYQNGITLAQAQALLAQMAQTYADAVLQFSAVTLTQHQLDALTSFCYNVGTTGYRDSTVRIAVNTGGDVCGALRQYIHAAGQVLPGLVARREAECELYYKEDDGVSQAQYDELKQDIANILGTLAAKADDQKVNDLANAVDALSPAWPLRLKGLWFVAKKAWPF